MVGRWSRRFAATAIVIACAATAVDAEDRGSVQITGAIRTYDVSAGDTWQRVASRFGVDVRTLAADNGLTITRPLHTGQQLRVDNRHILPDAAARRPIVVNVPQRMLFFTEPDGGTVAFPVAVGRSDWRTPLGAFTIMMREQDPSWEVPESIQEEARRAGKSLPPVVPPGPDNPLGKFWLGLSLASVGIHGTNAPLTIYRVATHGCIRLHPDDIAALFERVETGTPGEVVYQAILLAAAGEDILLEAHPDVYRLGPSDPVAEVYRRAALLGVLDRIDTSAVARVVKAREGIARSVVARTQ
jgi:L,D-transpeptidase ErfK/SrfK